MAPSAVRNVAPHFCGNPALLTRSEAPIEARASLTDASSDSPMWNRGNTSRSMTTTRRPARASHDAADDPAGPPPTTMTSQVFLYEAEGSKGDAADTEAHYAITARDHAGIRGILPVPIGTCRQRSEKAGGGSRRNQAHAGTQEDSTTASFSVRPATESRAFHDGAATASATSERGWPIT